MTYYIAYGSNLNTIQMKYRCPDAKIFASAYLSNHELVFRGASRGGVATVERKEGSRVPIGIWTISDSDERALDRYEGFPFLYTKKFVALPVKNGHVTAMMYVMNSGRKIAPPSDIYLATIAEGYDDFGFDTDELYNAASRAK